MNWSDLTKKIAIATRQAFDELKTTHPNEDFYALALYTDSSAMTVLFAANSQQNLEQIIGQDPDIDPASLAYYRWTTSEWGYEGWGAGHFLEISRQLRTSSQRENLAVFRSSLISSMTESLAQLPVTDSVLFISITDDDAAKSVENQSANILNPPSRYTAFLNRYTDFSS